MSKIENQDVSKDESMIETEHLMKELSVYSD
jgi:hypothetical protein